MNKNFQTDVIIVSDGKSEYLRAFTQNAISSAGRDVNVIVVESHKNAVYPEVTMVYPDEEFNYNRFLNIGASHGSSDYIFFANNDVHFYKNWEEELIGGMHNAKLVSASPLCPVISARVSIIPSSGIYLGYEIITRFCGWAFMWTRSFYEQVGRLNENYDFWCSDNICVEQLKSRGQHHGLVTSSLVHHFGSSTLKTLDASLIENYTTQNLARFKQSINDSETRIL